MKPSWYRRVNAALEAAGIVWPGGADNMAVRRTYAGHWQKSAGALTWILTTSEGGVPFTFDVGGYWPASTCVGDVVASRETFVVVVETAEQRGPTFSKPGPYPPGGPNDNAISRYREDTGR